MMANETRRLFELLRETPGAAADKRAQRVAVRECLESGADPNDASETGLSTFLEYAAHGGGECMLLRALIRAGADPGQTDGDGNTALHLVAARAMYHRLIRTLIDDAGVDIDARNHRGATALHIAAAVESWQSATFVEGLLAAGADPAVVDGDGRIPLEVALGGAREVLLPVSLPALSGADQTLIDAAGRGDLEQVRRLCGDGADPAAGDPSRGMSTSLHVAVAHPAVVEFLFARTGVDVDVRDERGRTPLHVLLDRRDDASDLLARVRRLIELGADVNAADAAGRSPMFLLASIGTYNEEIEIFDCLVAAGARRAMTDNRGLTVLDEALESTDRLGEQNDLVGYLRMVRHLVATGVPRTLARTGFRSRHALESWVEAKLNQHSGGDSARVRVDTTGRRTFERVFAAYRDLSDRDMYLDIDGEGCAVAAFDWFDLLDMEANDEGAYADQIRDYHIAPGEPEDRVTRGEWAPFGIIGITGALDSYEETSVRGTLFVDMTAGAGTPVVSVSDDGTISELPLSLGELMATMTVAP